MNIELELTMRPTCADRMTKRQIVHGMGPLVTIEVADTDDLDSVGLRIDATLPGEDNETPTQEHLREFLEFVIDALTGDEL